MNAIALVAQRHFQKITNLRVVVSDENCSVSPFYHCAHTFHFFVFLSSNLPNSYSDSRCHSDRPPGAQTTSSVLRAHSPPRSCLHAALRFAWRSPTPGPCRIRFQMTHNHQKLAAAAPAKCLAPY